MKQCQEINKIGQNQKALISIFEQFLTIVKVLLFEENWVLGSALTHF